MPGETVGGASLASYDNRYLYLSGGNSFSRAKESSQKVHRFDIEKSKWTEAPDLNRARYQHSGCALSDTLYIFGGFHENSKWIGNIESLNVREEVKARGANEMAVYWS